MTQGAKVTFITKAIGGLGNQNQAKYGQTGFHAIHEIPIAIIRDGGIESGSP
jgi:hypothetical protein